MTEEIAPEEFYQKTVKGTDYSKEVSLQHAEGYTLSGVEMHVVQKETLMEFVSALPDQMLERVSEAETEEEAKEMASNMTGAVNKDTVRAFESVCKESLSHPELFDDDMEDIVDALSFEVLFKLGTQIVNMSFEHDGKVQDFVERS